MSIFGLIASVAVKQGVRVLTKRLTSRPRTPAPAPGLPTIQPASFQPAGFLPDIGVPGPGVFSQDRPPAGFHLSKRAPFHFVRNRRMNFANGRAAKRSLRRIVGTMKLLRGIEKELTKAAPKRPRARAPAAGGHRVRLEHD